MSIMSEGNTGKISTGTGERVLTGFSLYGTSVYYLQWLMEFSPMKHPRRLSVIPITIVKQGHTHKAGEMP